MLIDQITVKEVNEYYALRGGRRTARIHNFANCLGEISAKRSLGAGYVRKETSASAASGSTPDSTAATYRRSSGSARSAGSHNSGYTTADSRISDSSVRKTAESAHNDQSSADSAGHSCCDKCQVTNQLLQMMADSLYTRNILGYSSVGSGALAAYQSMSKFLGTGFLS